MPGRRNFTVSIDSFKLASEFKDWQGEIKSPVSFFMPEIRRIDLN